MSINVYLKSDEVKKLEGFISVPYRDGSGNHISFNGMHLSGNKDQMYLMLSNGRVIPDELKNLVEEISCYESIPRMSHREPGIYRYQSAKCELTPADHGNSKRSQPVYSLKITAKNLEDIQEIAHKIKVGSIRPDESYAGPQSGLSRAKLETMLRITQNLVKLFQEELDAHRNSIAAKRDKLVNFLDKLGKKNGRPSISKKKVAEEIRKIWGE